MRHERMSASELRAGASLACVFGLRMLGLFVILPVFAAHAPMLAGGENLTLVGVALGAYGLCQAILQIPFGMASDRLGRKPVIYAGLAIFAAGSFVAAGAEDIWSAIAGRALQGAGAISSVVVALAADLTGEGQRTRVMAMIGSTIGVAFALSLVGAPLLYRAIGMDGIFALTGVLALGAVGLVALAVPDAPARVEAAPAGAGLGAAFAPELLRLDFGILVLHMAQMGMFVVLPSMLVEAGIVLADHWKVYLPVVLASFALMLPAVLRADRPGGAKPVLLGAVALLAAAQAALAVPGAGAAWLVAMLAGFFVAFNVLEALLPALVSRLAPQGARGTAIGVYNTAQTLGLFLGGLAGGWIAGRHGPGALFGACAALSLVWLAVAFGMRVPVRTAAAVNAAASRALDSRHSTAKEVRVWHRSTR